MFQSCAGLSASVLDLPTVYRMTMEIPERTMGVHLEGRGERPGEAQMSKPPQYGSRPFRKDIALRPYQQETKGRTLAAWSSRAGILVQMPTGTGKTVVLASLVSEMIKDAREVGCVWLIAHRRELVEQIEATVERYGIRKEDGLVRVMSIQWLSCHWEDMKDERPSLIVIDEAHHALAETYQELWRRYPDAKKLGMTATPCRLNRKGFTDLFETLITSWSIAEFIRQGWLSVFDYVSVRPDSDDYRLIGNLQKRGADGDYQIKEMDTALNRRPSIERLYESVRRYADGKKGIVYAISIAHARNIAAYYSGHGLNAVAIDSKTPAKERKRQVEDFRQGRLQVLVNVDVFSEGFDCPEVEFVQLARPTLSLARYLQQVGRGLRKSAGKENCMLIDNVGLYRLFGLPTVERDWQAMFEGRLAGKGHVSASQAVGCCTGNSETTDLQDAPMEWVVTHDRLLDCLASEESHAIAHSPESLSAFKDKTSGLYGLRRSNLITAVPRYHTIFDIKDSLVAVRFENMTTGIVDENGAVKLQLGRRLRLKFQRDRLLAVTARDSNVSYIDLMNGQTYGKKPEVLDFGKIHLLKVGCCCYSRTREVYKSEPGGSRQNVFNFGFFLWITDYFSTPRCRQVNEGVDGWNYHSVCLLSDDHETYYYFSGLLPDGSIVVADRKGKYYHVEEGKGKRYIACEHPKTEAEDFDIVVPRLKAEAEKQATARLEQEKSRKAAKRSELLAEIAHARPFKSGMRWGLKLGERIVVPPIYRNIQEPVGNYCAFESNPQQWGVLMLDGEIVIEARYMNIEIRHNGTARLTVIPGKVKTVKL